MPPASTDAEIVLKELKQAAELARLGIHLGIARLNAKDKSTANIPKEKRRELADELEVLIKNHNTLWTIRNREGGLKDSSGKLEDLLNYLRK